MEKPQISKKEFNFIIWLVPLISLIVGGWLVYKYYQTQGPLIEIYFKNSGGLEPGKSFVRFRDVKVGLVEKVKLLKKGVLVEVRMRKDVEPFLNSTTKFWIVKPMIEVGKVRGLEALLSGPFIQMYAKEKGFTKTTFKGLQEPPLNPSVLNGKIFTLVAPRSYGLSEKMPVYYKDIKVGTIRRVILQKKEVKVIISINRKYQNYINDTTRFWNIRGIDVSFDKSSLKLQIPGISQLLIGGIGFDTLDFNAKLTKKTFFLYSSRNDAYQNRLGNNRKYITMVMIVNNDKNGLLKVGNPVMFKNFKIGYIEYMHSYLNLKNLDIISICYLKIDEGAFNGKKGIIKALKKGLSAEIEITNPIFDSVAVNLVFRGKGKINYFNNNLVLPVVKSKPSQIISNIKKLIKKLASVDYKGAVDSVKLFFKQNSPKLKSVLENLSKVLKSTNTLLDNNQTKQIPENINKTIIDFDKAVKAYGPNSLFFIKFNQTLKDADETFKVLEKVGKKIDEKPNSLIFGD